MSGLNGDEIAVTLSIFFIVGLIGMFCLIFPPFREVVMTLVSTKYGVMLILVAFATVMGLSLTSLGAAQPFVVGGILAVIILLMINYWRVGFFNTRDKDQNGQNPFRWVTVVMSILIVFLIGCSAIVVDEDRFFGESANQTENEVMHNYLNSLRAWSCVGLVVFWAFFIFLIWQTGMMNGAKLLVHRMMIMLITLLSCYVFSKVAGPNAGWVMLALFITLSIICGVVISLPNVDFKLLFKWKKNQNNRPNDKNVFFVVYSLIFCSIFNLAVTYSRGAAGTENDEEDQESNAPPLGLQVFSIFMFVAALIILIFAGTYTIKNRDRMNVSSVL